MKLIDCTLVHSDCVKAWAKPCWWCAVVSAQCSTRFSFPKTYSNNVIDKSINGTILSCANWNIIQSTSRSSSALSLSLSLSCSVCMCMIMGKLKRNIINFSCSHTHTHSCYKLNMTTRISHLGSGKFTLKLCTNYKIGNNEQFCASL